LKVVARGDADREALTGSLRDEAVRALSNVGARPSRVEVQYVASLDRADAPSGKVKLVGVAA